MNRQMTSSAVERPIFRALLVPHRSLGARGFAVVMGLVIIAWAMTSIVFLARGAWPVFLFFSLVVVAIFLAFFLNYRSGRQREEIRLSRSCLEILQVRPSGNATRHRFNPSWTRFDVARHEEIGIVDMVVSCRGIRVAIGAFLNPDDRESFAAAFGRALASAQR